jgi:AraC family transcriptional regulator
MMKPQSNILMLQANGKTLPAGALSRVVLWSSGRNWPNLVVEEHHISGADLDNVKYVPHVVGVNIGRSVTHEVDKRQRLRQVFRTGMSSLFPSHHPFFTRRRKEENGFTDALFVALDPDFVSQTAADLEVHPDSVELLEQRGVSDPALLHIVMALREGLRDRRAGDAMYGEALSTALAVHILRKYGGIATGLQHATGGLSRDKLMRAIEYIQDQLESGLTVSGIAQAVHMSPYHFARLFKQSTGNSPYRYVIHARAKRAKELLKSGKFSIVEIAHRLGFADQSHLNRQLKDVFGATPKMLQAR